MGIKKMGAPSVRTSVQSQCGTVIDFQDFYRPVSGRSVSVMRKPTMWFLNRSDTNRAVQAQKMARGWKFWI